jgi:hypothetical protein
MKKLLFAVLLSMGAIMPACKNSQSTEERADKKNMIDAAKVPAAVIEAFTARYPNVTEIIWEKAHEGDMDTYKVKFKKRAEYLKAEYTLDGKLIKVETDE